MTLKGAEWKEYSSIFLTRLIKTILKNTYVSPIYYYTYDLKVRDARNNFELNILSSVVVITGRTLADGRGNIGLPVVVPEDTPPSQ